MARIIKPKLIHVTPWKDVPRSFQGVVIARAKAGGKRDPAPCPLLWATDRSMELTIYRSGDIHLGVVVYKTAWDDEYPSKRVTLIETRDDPNEHPEAMAKWLSEFKGQAFASLLPPPASQKMGRKTVDVRHVEWLWMMVREYVLEALMPKPMTRKGPRIDP